MKSRSGGAPRVSASVTSISPAMAGCTARAWMRSPTGAMMKKVRNSVSPTSIWFEGMSCVPSACLKKWKTMAILVKDVMITRIAGMNDSSVRKMTICSGAETAPTPFTWRSSWFMTGPDSRAMR